MSTQPSESSQSAAIGGAEHGAEHEPERPTLWQWLTEPHESIQEVGARHMARLLSAFLVISMMMASLGIFANLSSPGVLLTMGVGDAIVVVGYLFSRTRHYRLAAALVVLVCIVGPTISTYVGEPPRDITVVHLVWVFSAVLLGSWYLPLRVMVLVTLASIIAVLVTHFAHPVISTEALLNVVWLMGGLSVLVLLMTYHRNAIEKERLAVLERRSVELARLNRGMETMLYVISHDLKEPLRAIQNFSTMVERRYSDKLDDKGQDFLRRVVRGARRMRILLDDLLQLSRAQRIERPKKPVPGAEIVAAALGRLEATIAETGAEIRVADDLPAFRVDISWASGAIYNLVENALKYTVDGAGPEVEIAAYRGPRGVGLAVADRGPGVEPEHRERIFELFQRAVGRDVPGTGAGLAIVRQIAERHGGAAWVEPRSGGGSAFYITFQGPIAGPGPMKR